MKKAPVTRFSVSLPPQLQEQFDEMAEAKAYGKRPLAIADMHRSQ